jgi:hypothetical protein
MDHRQFGWIACFESDVVCYRPSGKFLSSFLFIHFLIATQSPDIIPQWRPLKADGTILGIEGASPSRPGSLACVTTTTSLLWFDERNYKEPLFVKRHFRVRDWSLRTDLGGRGAGGCECFLVACCCSILFVRVGFSRFILISFGGGDVDVISYLTVLKILRRCSALRITL